MVVDHLTWDNQIDASKILVEVDNREVILKGTVTTINQRLQAQIDAEDIEGVTYVNNELTIEKPLSPVNDYTVMEQIYNLLNWNPDINFDIQDITVGVEEGVVTLDGSVDAYWKKMDVERMVSEIRGVSQIVNRLAIVPTEVASDEQIAGKIVSALQRNRNVKADNVTAEVKKGVVTLSGVVNDWMAYYASQSVAENTEGVVDVVNRLSVK
jgi:osmotically-inducible protein OsmY